MSKNMNDALTESDVQAKSEDGNQIKRYSVNEDGLLCETPRGALIRYVDHVSKLHNSSRSLIDAARALCLAIEDGDTQTIADRMQNVKNALPSVDKEYLLEQLKEKALYNGVPYSQVDKASNFMFDQLIKSQMKLSNDPKCIARWSSEEEAMQMLGQMSLKDCESILNNVVDYYRNRTDAEALYAVVEIDNLSTAAFYDIGLNAEVAQVLSSFASKFVDDMASLGYDVSKKRYIKEINYTLTDTNGVEIGKFYFSNDRNIDVVVGTAKKGSLTAFVDVDMASLLKDIDANQDKKWLSRAVATQLFDISEHVLAQTDSFQLTTPCVQVEFEEPPHVDNVFARVKLVAIDGYLKTDKREFSDAICSIGDVGDPDGFNDKEHPVNELILHYFANQEEFDLALNAGGDGFDFVISSYRNVTFDDVRQIVASSYIVASSSMEFH